MSEFGTISPIVSMRAACSLEAALAISAPTLVFGALPRSQWQGLTDMAAALRDRAYSAKTVGELLGSEEFRALEAALI